jgi:hypothetical protein
MIDLESEIGGATFLFEEVIPEEPTEVALGLNISSSPTVTDTKVVPPVYLTCFSAK